MIERLGSDIRSILIKPSDFFPSIKNAGLPLAYQHYTLLLIFFAVLAGIVRMIGNSMKMMDFMMAFPVYGPIIVQKICPLFTEFGLLLALGTFLIGLYLVFILGGLLHAFVLLAGGEEGIFQTIKVLMYAATPVFLIGWIPVVGIIGFLWSLFITVHGLKECAGLSYLRSIMVVVVPIALLVLFLVLLLGLIASLTKVLNPLYWM